MSSISRRDFIKIMGLNAAIFTAGSIPLFASGKRDPNIIYILADDLGYGDINWLNKNSKIKTSNIDSLGKKGISFLDAHSGSAVCTPTRYGILTGRYCWRTKLQNGVTMGYSSPLIDKSRLTVASFLKKNGYSTGCVGKWYLGLDWGLKNEFLSTDENEIQFENVDFSKPVENGPTTVGFDYFFGISASLDMDPYVYIENDKVVELPTEKFDGFGDYKFARSGYLSPNFKHEEVLSKITEKAVKFINEKSKDKNPFFLYFPLTAPHTPIIPISEFQGKSGIGPYGDFLLQVDHTVGKILNSVNKNGIEDNTLIIFASDNGCSPQAKFDQLKTFGHNPSYVFRGYKSDIFEGGHRIPFIASWPGHIPENSFSNDPICLTDLFATASEIINKELPENSAEDSVSILKDLKGDTNTPVREAIVHHSIDGMFSIRKGKWKLELSPGSGGWSYPRNYEAVNIGLPMLQLYDLEKDIGEQENLQAQYPEIVNELLNLLEKYVAEGRSTPGNILKNDVEVDIWKYLKNRKDNSNNTEIDHLAKKAKLTLIGNSIIAYAANSSMALVDGIRGTKDFTDGNWVGIEGEDLEFIIELNKKQTIQKVTVGCLENQGSWVFYPQKIEVSALENDNFNLIGSISIDKPVNNNKSEIKNFSVNLNKFVTDTLKIKISSIKKCPQWHSGKGGKAWIFIDEVIVN